MTKADLFKKCYDYTMADDAKAVGLYPYFRNLTTKQGPVVQMEGREIIMLGSNNYLGITSHPDAIKAAREAVDKYGTGVSGSRFLNGTLDLHLTLEAELARFLEKEEALTFSTGFQANLAIISALVGRHDYVLCDRENHASIYDACRLSWGKMVRYNHNDMKDLEAKIKEIPETAGKLIVVDGVFSMSGAIADLPNIVKIAKKYGARVMVDDAHGFGTLGKTGKGTADHFGLTKDVDIIMGTFSKTLASMGGYMVGDAKVVDFVRHSSRPFIFSAAMPASNAASALAALQIMDKEPHLVTKLNEISNYARKKLDEYGIKYMDTKTPIITILTGTVERTFGLCNELFRLGVYVNPVIPPATTPNECLIRTSYMAVHTKELIDKAIKTIHEVMSAFPDSCG